jgi:DNA-binding CsgD family transcriptional regulator
MAVFETHRVLRGEDAGSSEARSPVEQASDRRPIPYLLIVDPDARVVYADRRTGWREMVDELGPMQGQMLPDALGAFVRAHTRQPMAENASVRAVLDESDIVASLLPLAGEHPPLFALALTRLEHDRTLEAAANRYALTRREEQILHAVLSGAPSQEIANRFSIRLATVEWHTKRLLMKTASSNRTEMVSRVLGWIVDET